MPIHTIRMSLKLPTKGGTKLRLRNYIKLSSSDEMFNQMSLPEIFFETISSKM